MGGSKGYTLPKVGRKHHVTVDGEQWEIRPNFDAVMMVAHVQDKLGVQSGVEMPFDQLAKLKRSCVEHLLTTDQQAQFNDLAPERQMLMAEKMFRIWKEIWSGNEELNPGEKPIEPMAPITEPGPDPTPSPSA